MSSNNTRLTPEMFGYKYPKPKREDFIIAYTSTEFKTRWCNNESYQKAIAEWKAKYVKPEPEWTLFGESKPKKDQWYYVFLPELPHLWKGDGTDRSWKWGLPPSKYEKLHQWTDAKTYDKQLAYYNQHQQVFDGWGYHEYVNWWSKHIEFTKGEIKVSFAIDKDRMSIENEGSGIYNAGTLDLFTFKAICKINNIEL